MSLPPQATHSTAHWFVVGHEPLLSVAELFALLRPSGTELLFLPPSVVRVTAPLPWSPRELARRLGGVVKIGNELAEQLTEDELLILLTENLKTIGGKIHFGLSWYDKTENQTWQKYVERWGKHIKRELKNAGFAARYIYKNTATLSSVTVTKNALDSKGREFLIVPKETGFAVAVTEAVQPFEELSTRDYGRPGRDDKSGMLPPKLAIMLLNLATEQKTDMALLDPFCGSGTILTEALLLGFTHLVGCDVSDKAIQDSRQNCKWIQRDKLPDTMTHVTLSQTDVRDLSKKISLRSVDAIATEPFMGPPRRGNETEQELRATILTLSELYQSAFSEFKKILKPGGAVVFIFPRFLFRNSWITLSPQLIPVLKKLGFVPERLIPTTLLTEEYILYHRRGQLVGREIWKFKLT